MGIKAKFTKGGLVLTGGYLMVNGLNMVRYNRPVQIAPTEENPNGSNEMVPATQYTARVQIYISQEDRDNNFGDTDFNSAFTFDHVDGEDPVTEAYNRIKNVGLENWVVTEIEDVL